MQTITTTQLHAEFVTKIRAIVPTYEPHRDTSRWAFVEGVPRKDGRPNMLGRTTRSYTLVIGAATPSFLWHGGLGTAYVCRLAVATSYAGIEHEQLQHMLTADAVDLRGALAQLRDPTVAGLCDAKPLGLQNESADDVGNLYVEHVFEIHYHQATDAD
jgi:hypothetical protein